MLGNDHVFHEQEYTQLLKPNYNPRSNHFPTSIKRP